MADPPVSEKEEQMFDSGLDKQVIARLEAGDDHAFADLFSNHRVRLKQMLEFRMDRRLRRREDASDILQEVYIDAHQRMRHYLAKPQLSFYIWLRQLTQQRMIDIHRRHLKAEMRDINHEVSHVREGADATSVSIARRLVAQLASPSQVAIQDEMVEQIRQGLDSLDELDREVLALRHFEELRNNEVAQVLGIGETAASNRYVRALSRLREVLEGIEGFFDDL